jgi:hypothetical protein
MMPAPGQWFTLKIAPRKTIAVVMIPVKYIFCFILIDLIDKGVIEHP